MRTVVKNQYFHPRKFVGNNIDYRIGSSAALAKFKEAQTFIFNQLAFNPYHEFSYSAKEILLLRFDVYFDLLCEIEQYLLIKQDEVKFDDVWDMNEERKDYVINTLLEQCTDLDKRYFLTYLKLMSPLSDYHEVIVKNILENEELSLATKFSAITDLIINVLHHILYVLQELDIVFYTENKPIINLDILSCELETSEGILCPAINRIEIYSTIREINSIVIKDYIDIDYPIKETKLYEFMERKNIKYQII